MKATKNKLIDFKLTKQNIFLLLWVILNFSILVSQGEYLLGNNDLDDFIDDLKDFYFFSNLHSYDWSELLIYCVLGFVTYAVFDSDKSNVAKTIKSIISYSLICIPILIILGLFRKEEVSTFSESYWNHFLFGIEVNQDIYEVSRYVIILLVFSFYPLIKGIKWLATYSKN